jgi:hypothetical protein
MWRDGLIYTGDFDGNLKKRGLIIPWMRKLITGKK